VLGSHSGRLCWAGRLVCQAPVKRSARTWEDQQSWAPRGAQATATPWPWRPTARCGPGAPSATRAACTASRPRSASRCCPRSCTRPRPPPSASSRSPRVRAAGRRVPQTLAGVRRAAPAGPDVSPRGTGRSATCLLANAALAGAVLLKRAARRHGAPGQRQGCLYQGRSATSDLGQRGLARRADLHSQELRRPAPGVPARHGRQRAAAAEPGLSRRAAAVSPGMPRA
jgi:hypothetical protein